MKENVENFEEPRPGEKYSFDAEQLAKEYAENVRKKIAEEKENQSDIHLSKINPDELTYQDLMIYDKFTKGNLNEEDLVPYCEDLRKHFDSQKEKLGDKFDYLSDSRANFLAMLRNKIISRRLEKPPAQRASGSEGPPV